MGHTTLERIEVTSQLPDELFDGSQPTSPDRASTSPVACDSVT